jgi:hypothetical protein
MGNSYSYYMGYDNKDAKDKDIEDKDTEDKDNKDIICTIEGGYREVVDNGVSTTTLDIEDNMDTKLYPVISYTPDSIVIDDTEYHPEDPEDTPITLEIIIEDEKERTPQEGNKHFDIIVYTPPTPFGTSPPSPPPLEEGGSFPLEGKKKKKRKRKRKVPPPVLLIEETKKDIRPPVLLIEETKKDIRPPIPYPFVYNTKFTEKFNYGGSIPQWAIEEFITNSNL